MRLLVKRGHSLINDLRFSDGPIYIGRQPQCQVFLPDRSVSRQHAVLYASGQGDWMLQDLKSANRTTLNGRPISKVPVHEGDVIGVSDFMLEVHFQPEAKAPTREKPLDLGDTLVSAQAKIPSVYQTTRNLNQPIRISPPRMRDFYQLNLLLFRVGGQEELLDTLTKTLLDQMDAYHVWAGLRETTSGPLTCHGGYKRGGATITLEGLFGKKIIKQAVDEATYILLPDISEIPAQSEGSVAGLAHLRSAIACPIVAPAGTYGIIYLDNGVDKSSYTMQDLDYLTLVSTEIAAFVEHLG